MESQLAEITQPFSNQALKRVRQELDLKLQATNNDLWKAIRAYNGSGPAAENYMRNVKAFTAYCAEVVGE
jgi:hypothetical protein